MLDNKEIGKNLEKARVKLGLNKAKFALPAGIDSSHYGRAERGIEGLGREKLHFLAEKHGVNPDFLFTGRGPILVKDINIPPITGDPTVDKLAQALADQAEANKIQAVANEKYAEGFKALSIIAERIEKNMALEDTQGQVKISLKGIRSDVTKLVERQQTAIKEFRDEFLILKTGKNSPSKGVRKKAGRSDHDH